MDIHRDWRILEADFRREYGIDLVTARLSWRAFLVYANALSKNAVWVMTFEGRNNGEIAIEDDEAAERAMERML